MKKPFVRFSGSDENILILGYGIYSDRVSLKMRDIVEHSEGFIIYQDDQVIFDGSDFIYRWDVLDQRPNEIWYTNDPELRQTKPWPVIPEDEDIPQEPDPLTNEEITQYMVGELGNTTPLALEGMKDILYNKNEAEE